MKIKEFLILASVLLAPVSTSLSAKENITGAFGVKLGQTLSSQMIKTSELKFTYEGDDRYSFSPDKKFRSFSTYTIKITPKTRKIYFISAKKEMSEPEKKEGWIDLSSMYGAGTDLFDRTYQPDSLPPGEIGAAQAGARLDSAYEEDGNAFLQAEQLSSTESRDEHDDSTCEKEQALIMAIIKKKYWEIEQQYSSFSPYGKQVINQGNRSVAIQCGGIYNAPLNIRYLDSKLSELAENERVALERSKVIIKVIMFILSIIFFAISAIICWRVDREKCKSLKTYLAKILVGVAALSVSIACLVPIRDEEVIKFILSIMFFTVGAIICWRVDREKCKSLEAYLAKILIGVAAFSVSIVCLIETGEEELIKFMLGIMFFTISAIICWRVDREKCKSLETYLAKILVGVAAFSGSIACLVPIKDEEVIFILSIMFFTIGAIIFWRVDREKCKSLKTYLAKILVGVAALSVSIACLVPIRDEEVIKFILSIMFFTVGAIICWRVDREKCKSLEAYLAKILIGVVVCSISIACVIGMDDAEGPMVILSIIFFAIGAIICWRVDREKCKTLEAYLSKILIGVIAFSISIVGVIRIIMAL